MKKSLLILAAVVILLSACSCMSQKTKNERKEALTIAQSIPKPSDYYSSRTGRLMMPLRVSVCFDGYDRDTGEGIFDFTFAYVESGWWDRVCDNFRTLGPFGTSKIYYRLSLTTPNPNYNPDINYTHDFYSSNYKDTSDKYITTRNFTLSDLQQHQAELEWK